MLDMLRFQTNSVRVDLFSYVKLSFVLINLHRWVKKLYIRLWRFFSRYRIAFARARKSYRIGLLFTHNNGDFGAISVTERSHTSLISKVKNHISDRYSYRYYRIAFTPARKPYRIGKGSCSHR